MSPLLSRTLRHSDRSGRRHGRDRWMRLGRHVAHSTNASSSGSGTTTAPTTSTTSTVAASTANYHPKIVPSQFTTKVDNKWFPLAVGDHRTYTGTRDGAPIAALHRAPQTKTVMGVKCVVVSDVVTSNHSLVREDHRLVCAEQEDRRRLVLRREHRRVRERRRHQHRRYLGGRCGQRTARHHRGGEPQGG